MAAVTDKIFIGTLTVKSKKQTVKKSSSTCLVFRGASASICSLVLRKLRVTEIAPSERMYGCYTGLSFDKLRMTASGDMKLRLT